MTLIYPAQCCVQYLEVSSRGVRGKFLTSKTTKKTLRGTRMRKLALGTDKIATKGVSGDGRVNY